MIPKIIKIRNQKKDLNNKIKKLIKNNYSNRSKKRLRAKKNKKLN